MPQEAVFSSGVPAGKNRSEEWGKLLAKSGYVVIHPSRVMVCMSGPNPTRKEVMRRVITVSVAVRWGESFKRSWPSQIDDLHHEDSQPAEEV
jgi:hypothetical protein